jgi:hypothetical protein
MDDLVLGGTRLKMGTDGSWTIDMPVALNDVCFRG